jgi:hypothetical protein
MQLCVLDCFLGSILIMLQFEIQPIMTIIFKYLGLELLTDLWDGFDSLDAKCFGKMIQTTFELA